MNALNKLYEAMLLSWGCLIKEGSQIVFKIDGKEYPITIDGQELYLPVSDVLDNNCVGKVFFHPACENITSKETEVFKIIRKATTMRMLDVFRNIPAVLFQVAGRAAKSTWNQRTLDLLEPLKNVKQPIIKEVSKLFARMEPELDENGLDNRFIHFKTSKGASTSKITGQKIYYKTKPSFPFYTEIVRRLARSEGQPDNQTIELNNHSVSRAALKVAAHLFQVIIPAVSDPDSVETEATSSVASRLTSFLLCYAEIVDEMNRVQNTFRADFDKVGLYPIDTSWTEYLEELPDIWRQVPVMDYNSHNTQEEAAVSNTSVGNIMAVSSQNPQNSNHHHQQSNQMPQPGNIVNGYDVSPPPMVAGDKWLKYEIDYANNKVIHHAINTINNNPVVYTNSSKGNFLYRQENAIVQNAMNQLMSGMGGVGGGMGGIAGATMMGNGMVMLPNGNMIPQAVYMAMMGGNNNNFSALMPSVQNNNNNNGYYNASANISDGQAFG